VEVLIVPKEDSRDQCEVAETNNIVLPLYLEWSNLNARINIDVDDSRYECAECIVGTNYFNVWLIQKGDEIHEDRKFCAGFYGSRTNGGIFIRTVVVEIVADGELRRGLGSSGEVTVGTWNVVAIAPLGCSPGASADRENYENDGHGLEGLFHLYQSGVSSEVSDGVGTVHSKFDRTGQRSEFRTVSRGILSDPIGSGTS